MNSVSVIALALVLPPLPPIPALMLRPIGPNMWEWPNEPWWPLTAPTDRRG